MRKKRVLIMGAGGRDFHNFLVYYKNNPNYEVVAFTATQIPFIDKRVFPKELVGKRYKKDIPIYSEEKLVELIKKLKIDEVNFAYSDVSNEYVMEKASKILAAGASFRLLGPKDTMLKSKKFVISICASRTGAGKSPLTRKVCQIVRKLGFRVVVIRHPMPYGDLRKQICQRFERLEDLEKFKCTIEEREEFEQHILNGFVVYSGIDYKKILRRAEKEADIIVWDGGNNDFPFLEPNFHILVTDARRPGHEIKYYPSFINLMLADLVIINKVSNASKKAVKQIEKNVKRFNPKAKIIYGDLKVYCENSTLIRGKEVLCIEDGPTLTHGELKTGAAFIAAKKYGAKKIVDARKYACGSIKQIFRKYKHLGKILPAVGYSESQLKELEKTINRTECDLILIGTPTDLRKYLNLNKPALKVNYEFKERGNRLEKILKNVLISKS